ncbi:hypothetical protein OJE16_02465 [Pantoea tagorei]
MNDKKMISIDQFTPDERLAVDGVLKGLIEKYRQRTGKEPDVKKEKEFTAEARQQIMSVKLAKEKSPGRESQKRARRAERNRKR